MTTYGYVRVSTQEQGRSGLGLDAQRRALEAEADRRGWEIEWVVDDGHSAKDLNRPGVTELLGRVGEGDVVLVAKLDRLSRSLVDFAGIMERARSEGWSLIALDLGVDMTTPAGRLVANVMASVAEWEREVISERTRDALAEARANGVHVGRPREAGDDVIREATRLRRSGLSWRAVAEALTEAGVPTTRGGARWSPSSAASIVRRHASAASAP